MSYRVKLCLKTGLLQSCRRKVLLGCHLGTLLGTTCIAKMTLKSTLSLTQIHEFELKHVHWLSLGHMNVPKQSGLTVSAYGSPIQWKMRIYILGSQNRKNVHHVIHLIYRRKIQKHVNSPVPSTISMCSMCSMEANGTWLINSDHSKCALRSDLFQAFWRSYHEEKRHNSCILTEKINIK